MRKRRILERAILIPLRNFETDCSSLVHRMRHRKATALRSCCSVDELLCDAAPLPIGEMVVVGPVIS